MSKWRVHNRPLHVLEAFDTCVYLLYSTRDRSIIRYIGVTSESPNKRLKRHFWDSKRNVSYKDRWVAKEIGDGFHIKMEVIISFIQFSHALQLEMKFIKEAKELGLPLVNTTNGGDGYRGTHSLQHRHNQSVALKGRKMPAGFSESCSIRYTGRKATEESKRKASLSLKGRQFSDEHRSKLSASAQGKKLSEERRSKLIIASTGRIKTKEENEKRLKRLHISVIQILPDGSEKVWDSSKHVLSIDSSSIIKVCNGKRKTAGGFRWKYADPQKRISRFNDGGGTKNIPQTTH